jgi:hypothetical protein
MPLAKPGVNNGTRGMLRQDQPRDRNRSRAARASHE